MATPNPARYLIITLDGGADFLEPGRWMAYYVWDGISSESTYGATEIEAIEKTKDAIRTDHPESPWLEKIPVLRMR